MISYILRVMKGNRKTLVLGVEWLVAARRDVTDVP